MEPGFDPAETGYGTGLQGMVDRLDALGGAVRVESIPGRAHLSRAGFRRAPWATKTGSLPRKEVVNQSTLDDVGSVTKRHSSPQWANDVRYDAKT